ncbi:hypothetical protein TSOC_011919 [Tetrabaena socialis]|uniref:Pherophorin domain-containing protein n=1 Tax=Tetrabaena socialis TaxID=47790 RepID=A0A2J7ZPD7_9CHLO|nr:hypothetical protein TSOC_011919 [Tetrabaena socialis]|eukprot:PNH02128.1 hypothetical protein TSOC_011919 [Tetrabaena socialis]
MRIRGLVALCGLWLAAAGVRAQLGFEGASGLSFVPRFTRLLKQDLSSVASYLLPTQQPELCANNNGNCCQHDSYASPYGLTYLNHTQQNFGGRTYTTFFYQFHSNSFCDSGLDYAKCCTASADNIWVDVDPTLRVKYVSFNGQRLANTEQGEFGLKLGAVNLQVSQAKNGIPVTITVEGAADALCPPPGLAPLPGLCELVVQGATPANPNACCPSTITLTSLAPFEPPADSFQCSASLASSPYKLVFDGVSAPQTVAGQQYVSYNFRLTTTSSCASDGVTNCCSAQLAYLDLKVTDLPITAVQLNSRSIGFSSSAWNEPNSASYRSLVVDNLNLVADDLGAAGLPLTITVRLPAGGSGAASDLCDASSDPNQGACNYYLHSEDGFCCPAGLALPAISVPPPPAGTCAPTTNVPVAETSMSLQYYEKSASAASTTFSFLLANHNPQSGCTKQNCVDVCSWTLYLDPAASSQLSVGHENAANNGRQIISSGTAPSSVTFTYGPTGESTMNFYVTLPAGGKKLSDLCARNALPAQGSKACAAVVRSKSVYIMVFFDESDVIIVAPAPSPPPTQQLCAAPKRMSDSCLAVSSGRYNTLLGSAVFDFAVTPAAAGAACIPPSPPSKPTSVHLVLSSSAVDQLTTHGRVRPSTNLGLDRNDGARWSLASYAAVTNLAFQVQGPLGVSDVCRQGVTPDQPANTCLVEVEGDNGCFRGFVAASADGRLTWDMGAEQPRGKGIAAAVVVPAVVIPAVVLLAALAILAAWYRRRRSQRYESADSIAGSNDLSRPLAGQGGSNAGSLARDDLSVPSASPSDVHIRVPGASQGGSAPAGRR